ncbi:MAG: DeoR/GlpR transcriptional regulator [Armatimonadetes bacterium]|nr:DeoR/GlpR transcriptional regulator [Armatimonadota bacterium]
MPAKKQATSKPRSDRKPSSEPSATTQAGQKRLWYTEFQEQQAKTEKDGIAIFVANMIEKGCPVFLDAGSTVSYIAREIFRREAPKVKQSLTIMTNNMRIFNSFNQGTRQGGPRDGHSLSLLLTGGHYDNNHDALFGNQAKDALDKFYPRYVVMGCSGLTVKEGLFVFGHTDEQVIKQAIFTKPTYHRIIACDCGKIGRTDSFLCQPFKELVQHTRMCTVVTSFRPDNKSDDSVGDHEDNAENCSLGNWSQQLIESFGAEVENMMRVEYQKESRYGALRLVQVDEKGVPIYDEVLLAGKAG